MLEALSPAFSVAFRDWGGPVSEQGSTEHFHSPQNVGVETSGRARLQAGRAAGLATPATPGLAMGAMQTAPGLPQQEENPNKPSVFLTALG